MRPANQACTRPKQEKAAATPEDEVNYDLSLTLRRDDGTTSSESPRQYTYTSYSALLQKAYASIEMVARGNRESSHLLFYSSILSREQTYATISLYRLLVNRFVH